MKTAVATSLAIALSLCGTAHAQTTISIAMTAPPAAPGLHAPLTTGARPSTPFLFAIPATGQSPLTFAATGLPAGLTIASSTGIISGTTPAAGSYPVTVTATNGAGSATATYTIVSGNTLALTPPMGWNSYDSFGDSVTEQEMIDEATAVKMSMQPFGWNTVVIDYRWYEPGQPIDANGRYLPATSKHPSATGSNGFKPLADKIHAIGLNFGIHIMRGIPRKSYDANSPIAGSTYTAKDAGNNADPCPWDTHMWGVRGDTAAGQAWYDSIFAQYASWGIDFIKIDDMLNNSTKVYHQAEVDAIRKAIDKSGRAILLSLSPGPDDPAWLPNSSSHLNTNANMWRIVNDFWDTGDGPLCDLGCAFTAIRTWGGVGGLTPGHWPDADMLPLGYLGPRKEWTGGNHQTNFTKNEQVTVMSLWTMLPSPLIFGGNPMRLSNDAWTLALLTNPEVLAVSQDVLGARGKRTASGSNEILGARSQRRPQGGRVLQPRRAGCDDVGDVRVAGRDGDAGRSRSLASRGCHRHDDQLVGQRARHRGADVHAVTAGDRRQWRRGRRRRNRRRGRRLRRRPRWQCWRYGRQRNRWRRGRRPWWCRRQARAPEAPLEQPAALASVEPELAAA